MKAIPFVAAEPGTDGRQAVYHMLLKHFLPGEPAAAELEEFMAGEPDIALKRQGFDIQRCAPTLAAADALLAENYLIGIFSPAHSYLLIQRAGEKYILHDPAKPEPSRHVSPADLHGILSAAAEIKGFIFRNAYRLKRLDQYVVLQKPRLSRAYAAKLIEQGDVLVNGRQAKPGYRVQPGDTVAIDFDESVLDSVPPIDLPVLYEDDDCIVINKPAGVLTHAQGKFAHEATVATFLRSRLKDDLLSGERAGIVHRLDRATSGVIICAKTGPALSWLQKQFADRTAHKTYLAVTAGHLQPKEAIIDMPIERNPKAPATFRAGPNGKPATTAYKVLEESAEHSVVELKPRTGRTHQLRVHLKQLGHPIVGDPLYGRGAHGDRLYLHAYKLEITLPSGEAKTFTAPLPPEFRAIMNA